MGSKLLELRKAYHSAMRSLVRFGDSTLSPAHPIFKAAQKALSDLEKEEIKLEIPQLMEYRLAMSEFCKKAEEIGREAAFSEGCPEYRAVMRKALVYEKYLNDEGITRKMEEE